MILSIAGLPAPVSLPLQTPRDSGESRSQNPSTDFNVPTNHNYDNRVKNPIYHVVWGVRFFFSGIRELTRQPALLGLSLIPILLTFVLLLGLALGGAWIAGRIVADVFGHDLRLFVEALTFALALVIGYFLYLPVARVLLAPFAEALSRKTHAINAGNAIRQSDLGSARAMWEGLKLVMFQSVIALLALALGLIFRLWERRSASSSQFSCAAWIFRHSAFDARAAIATEVERDLAQQISGNRIRRRSLPDAAHSGHQSVFVAGRRDRRDAVG